MRQTKVRTVKWKDKETREQATLTVKVPHWMVVGANPPKDRGKRRKTKSRFGQTPKKG